MPPDACMCKTSGKKTIEKRNKDSDSLRVWGYAQFRQTKPHREQGKKKGRKEKKNCGPRVAKKRRGRTHFHPSSKA